MSSVSAAPSTGPADPRRLKVVIGSLMLVMLLASLDQTIVSTALPTIVGELGGLEHLSWVVTAYLLAVTAVTPLYGKLGDIYGRKRVLQVALVLFLVGSVLCGMARGMGELIAFRAIQGMGGGGLMVSAQAAIGDVVSPRQRGRYNGLFGAVFGLSAVAGPLIGGFFTTHLSWRWIFYVNLPLGVVAFVALALTLPTVRDQVRHRIDYLGTMLLALGLVSLVLLTTLGGQTVAWGSATIVLLGIVGVAALIAFVFVEKRASEPIMPPRLFRIRSFSLVAAISLVVGFALFGSLTYLPLFQQVVRGLSPTQSGLELLPVMGGLLISSIVSGMLITKTGRYRVFPILGTALATIGLFLLAQLAVDTSTAQAALYMLVLGLGLGLVMQVLILVAQNSVPYAELGIATSAATLFRSIGGSVGTAILGAIFSNRLAVELSSQLPAGGAASRLASGSIAPEQVQRLPDPVRDAYIGSFTDALEPVFLVAAGIMAVAFLLTWLMPEVKLRQTVQDSAAPQESAAPSPSVDQVEELARQLYVAVGSRRFRRSYTATVEEVWPGLSPTAAWVLGRIARTGRAEPSAAVAEETEDEDATRRRQAAIAELRDDDLIEDDGPGVLRLTDKGSAAHAALTAAHEARLRALAAEWAGNEDPEVERLVLELAAVLAEQRPAVPA